MALHHFCVSCLQFPNTPYKDLHHGEITQLQRRRQSCRLRQVQSCMVAPLKKTTRFDQISCRCRRSANYQPPIWDYDYIQNLTSEYVGDLYVERAEKLKEDAKTMFYQVTDLLCQLELIDTVQRLGLSNGHFEDEINELLNKISNDICSNATQKQESLHTSALKFRILRQYGFNISPEIFNEFMNKMRNSKSSIGDDCKGVLSLYEAAYLLKEGESIFDEIKSFTTTYLNEYLNHGKLDDDEYLCTLVKHSLEVPLHWRMPRADARWFIDVYSRNPNANRVLLELATLDFNIVQAKYQEELKYVTRWWANTELGKELGFARDRMVENYLWSMGTTYEPRFRYCRQMFSKIFALITLIDDIYDVYGTLEELELFTNVVERWDVDAMDELPDYMKRAFLALVNTINEIAIDFLQEQRINILPWLKKGWVDLCQSYMMEARSYHGGHVPTFQEYIDNSWISIAGPLSLLYGYFFTTTQITTDVLDLLLVEYPSLIRSSSTIFRLVNDLATSSHESRRGDVAKSIQCYMHETGVSEEDAREHVRGLVSRQWMKLNKEIAENTLFSNAFLGLITNITKTAQMFFQHGDGYGIQDHGNKDCVLSLIINPIPYTPTVARSTVTLPTLGCYTTNPSPLQSATLPLHYTSDLSDSKKIN